MISDNELIAEGKVTENQLKGYQMENDMIEQYEDIQEHPNSCTCRSCEDKADQMQVNLEYNMRIYEKFADEIAEFKVAKQQYAKDKMRF